MSAKVASGQVSTHIPAAESNSCGGLQLNRLTNFVEAESGPPVVGGGLVSVPPSPSSVGAAGSAGVSCFLCLAESVFKR